jgi:hypothetical protein
MGFDVVQDSRWCGVDAAILRWDSDFSARQIFLAEVAFVRTHAFVPTRRSVYPQAKTLTKLIRDIPACELNPCPDPSDIDQATFAPISV